VLIGAGLAAQGALPRSAPERQGVSSAGVLAFVAAADTGIDAMHIFMFQVWTARLRVR
jgi:hypothetical protein